FRYDSGCMIAYSGRIVRHGVDGVEGDRIAWHVYEGTCTFMPGFLMWMAIEGRY
ncbi:hypothetical protein BDR07DRAFT_1321621, partial [Suillus spraguei]